MRAPPITIVDVLLHLFVPNRKGHFSQSTPRSNLYLLVRPFTRLAEVARTARAHPTNFTLAFSAGRKRSAPPSPSSSPRARDDSADPGSRSSSSVALQRSSDIHTVDSRGSGGITLRPPWGPSTTQPCAREHRSSSLLFFLIIIVFFFFSSLLHIRFFLRFFFDFILFFEYRRNESASAQRSSLEHAGSDIACLLRTRGVENSRERDLFRPRRKRCCFSSRGVNHFPRRRERE